MKKHSNFKFDLKHYSAIFCFIKLYRLFKSMSKRYMHRTLLPTIVSSRSIFHVFIYAAVLLLLIGTTQAVGTATIHGAVYEWHTFQPMENTIIEVNSTPPQSIVARYGLYSFNLAHGSYLITAKYYQNNTLTCFAEETITITDDGDYVLDLLLFPLYDEEIVNETEFTEITDDFNEETIVIDDDDDSGLNSGIIYLVAIILLFVIVRFSIYTYKKETSENEEISEKEETVEISPTVIPEEKIVSVSEETKQTVKAETTAPLPADLQEVMEIIKANGGRITQKELRSKLKYSEAKVSLMVSDLKQRGLIEKFKQGRGNIIRISDE